MRSREGQIGSLSTRNSGGESEERAPSFPPKSKLKQRDIFATATFSKPTSKAWESLCEKCLIISNEKFLVLLESCRSKNPYFAHSSSERFDLQNIDKTECLVEVSVRKQGIPVLANIFQLPINIHAHKEQFLIELKFYACYWEGFLILAVIQIWSVDVEGRFLSYACLKRCCPCIFP